MVGVLGCAHLQFMPATWITAALRQTCGVLHAEEPGAASEAQASVRFAAGCITSALTHAAHTHGLCRPHGSPQGACGHRRLRRVLNFDTWVACFVCKQF